MSVVEVARVAVDPARADEFETTFAEAAAYVRAAHGHQDSRLTRDVERPGSYLFIVTWDNIADHTTHFVASDGFRAFEEAIGPFLLSAPDVTHVETVPGTESGA